MTVKANDDPKRSKLLRDVEKRARKNLERFREPLVKYHTQKALEKINNAYCKINYLKKQGTMSGVRVPQKMNR